MPNDFGFVHIPDEPVKQEAENKPASKVTQRSIVKKEKVEKAANPEVNQTFDGNLSMNSGGVAQRATNISNNLPLNVPDLGVGKLVDQYGKPLATLGLLGLAAHKLLGGGQQNAPVEPWGHIPTDPVAPLEAKPDMRNIAAPATVAPVIPSQPPVPKGWEDIIAKSDANAASKAAAKANPVPTGYPQGLPQSNPMDELTKQPPAPQLIQPKPPAGAMPPVNAAPPAPLTPPPPAAPVDLVAAAQSGQDMSQPIKEDVAHMLQEADKTPSEIKVKGLVRDAQGNFQYPPGMSPAAIEGHKAFNQQYPEHARALEAEGKFGIVGGGAADNNLKNSYGVDLRKRILNEVNQGQMAGIYPNYSEKINPAIQALPKESGLGKILEELRVNNPKGGVQGPLGTPATIGKAGELVSKPGAVSGLVNKGGKALLLMAMADAAKASQEGNTAPAKEIGFDLGTGVLLAKLLGGPAAAALGLALGSSNLNANEEEELARRRASRGIAPPLIKK